MQIYMISIIQNIYLKIRKLKVMTLRHLSMFVVNDSQRYLLNHFYIRKRISINFKLIIWTLYE